MRQPPRTGAGQRCWWHTSGRGVPRPFLKKECRPAPAVPSPLPAVNVGSSQTLSRPENSLWPSRSSSATPWRGVSGPSRGQTVSPPSQKGVRGAGNASQGRSASAGPRPPRPGQPALAAPGASRARDEQMCPRRAAPTGAPPRPHNSAPHRAPRPAHPAVLFALVAAAFVASAAAAAAQTKGETLRGFTFATNAPGAYAQAAWVAPGGYCVPAQPPWLRSARPTTPERRAPPAAARQPAAHRAADATCQASTHAAPLPPPAPLQSTWACPRTSVRSRSCSTAARPTTRPPW